MAKKEIECKYVYDIINCNHCSELITKHNRIISKQYTRGYRPICRDCAKLHQADRSSDRKDLKYKQKEYSDNDRFYTWMGTGDMGIYF